MTIELEAQIQVVARARRLAVDSALQGKEGYARWADDNRDLLAQVEADKVEVLAQEAKLRELTLAVFRETGNKKPAEYVGIREGTELQYIKDEALAWAVEHKLALALDKAAFEKTVKATPSAFPFVQMIPTVTATIATEIPVR